MAHLVEEKLHPKPKITIVCRINNVLKIIQANNKANSLRNSNNGIRIVIGQVVLELLFKSNILTCFAQ